MLLKILGGADIVLSIILIFINSLNIHFSILWVGGIFLILKGGINFYRYWATWIDGTAGILLLFSSVFHIPSIIVTIVGLLLLQKGVYSFF
ncbi:MAG: hypothetical protein Q8P15_02315 [Nanoarchaeota archaeon]|nr:hypothetical protein [Nanoarchaeota archaeon]